MASTTPVPITIRKGQLAEIRASLELLDNPNSNEPGGKPTRYKFKNQSVTRYDLAMDYAEVSLHWRAVDKVHNDLIRMKLDAQRDEHPDAEQLSGKWLQDVTKEINAMREETVVLNIRPIPLSSLDMETNNLSFLAIGNLLGNIITDDTEQVAKAE